MAKEYSWRSVSRFLLPKNPTKPFWWIPKILSIDSFKRNNSNPKKPSSFLSSPWRWRVTTAMYTPYLSQRTHRSRPRKRERFSCRRSTSLWWITEYSVQVSLNRLVSASSSLCDSDPSCNLSVFDSVVVLVRESYVV